MQVRENYLQLIDKTLAYIQALAPPCVQAKPLPPLPTPKPKQIAQPPVSKPPSPPVKKQEPKQELSKELDLRPPTLPDKQPMNKMGSILKMIAPDFFIHDAPLADDKAKKIKGAWADKSQIPDIPILFQGNLYRTFTENLAKAISTCFSPSRVIEITPYEQEKKWDLILESPQLKLILLPDYLLFSSKELLPFYKENPGQKTRFLGDIPLLLLPDLSLYFKDPYLKRSLWNVICQSLDKPS